MSAGDKGGRPEGEAVDAWLASTAAVHAGEKREKAGHALTTPIAQTATYTFADTQALRDHFEGRTERGEYGRYGNPTQHVAEHKLADLEGTEAALLFSSGMAAITTTFLAMLRQGSHVVMTGDVYRRTRQFALTMLSRYGVDTTVVPAGDYDRLDEAVRPNTRLLFSESPTNPYLNVLDLDRFVEIGRKHRVKTVIDATFATPYNQRPADFGVDLVIHSATKYLGGHNDLLAGVICGSRALVGAIKETQAVLGGVLDPHACYLLIRGLKTFALRVGQQNVSAQAIAEMLEVHPKVRRVYYPGLASHPHHEIAFQQMRGYGGVVSFEIDGDLDRTSRFIDAIHIARIAPSLGGVESLIEQPALMSFYELTTEERLAVGIKDNLVRMSVGVEDTLDLLGDLEQALASI